MGQKVNVKMMKKCSRCRLPETYETIEFDPEGICNICRGHEAKLEIDWQERKKKLDAIIAEYRGKNQYDCIIPFSGGKDSTFQLLYLMKEYKIKPLVVRFNHGFLRPTIQENVQRTLKTLGCDFLEFTPNWHVVKKLMLESVRRKGDFCWHCHTGIYSYPIRVALLYKVPLVIWGEPQSEITAYYDYSSDEIEFEDEKKFNMLRTLGITSEDMHGMISSANDLVDERDLLPYSFPPVEELRDLGYLSVPLGSFIPWDYELNSKRIISELGWALDDLEGVPRSVNQHGEKIECFLQGTRDYLKFIKRGYGRATQINAFKVRQGRLSSEEAEQMNGALDGKKPRSLELFLSYVGLTEDEFNEIATQTSIPPYVHDFSSAGNAEKLWDHDSWDKGFT